VVDGFSSAFIGAAAVALTGAALILVWLRNPRQATAVNTLSVDPIDEERMAA